MEQWTLKESICHKYLRTEVSYVVFCCSVILFSVVLLVLLDLYWDHRPFRVWTYLQYFFF
jgi:hypothetical protein